MRRIGLGAAWLATLAVGAALLAAWLGWLPPGAAVELLLGALALGGLWLVVWLPWDLYFAARALAADQEDSVARGIEVSARDRATARQIAPRMLALCLGLHLGGAGLVGGLTWLGGGRTGYWLAGAYVLGMALRPIGALYGHLRARIAELSSRARYPREDVVSLRARVETLEADLALARRREEGLATQLSELVAASARRAAELELKLERVLGELERSVARLTEDKELLAGLRAFVRVVKQA